MDIVLWGAGTIGEAATLFLETHCHQVIAVIDGDENKIGKNFHGKEIISFYTYLTDFKEYYVLIAVLNGNHEVRKTLEQHQIQHFFDLLDVPADLFYLCRYMPIPFECILREMGILEKQKKIVLYGKTLFTIIFREYLIGKNCQVSVREIGDFPQNLHVQDSLSYQQERRYDIAFLMKEKQECTADVFHEAKVLVKFNDFTPMRCFEHENLKKFHNIYGSKDRCFIVGTGSSLTVQDLEVLQKHREICFSMNRAYKIFKKTGWRPKYYLMFDENALKNYGHEVVGMGLEYLFVPAGYRYFEETFMEKNNIYEVSCYRKDFLEQKGFFDLVRGVGNYNSSCEAMEIAIYMGFKEIYIVGMDGVYVGDGRDSRNHFVEDYGVGVSGNKETFKLDTDKLIQACESIQTYARAHGIKIFNATRGGKVEVFKRVDFDSLF